MTKDEGINRMTKLEPSARSFGLRVSSFFRHSSFVLRHSESVCATWDDKQEVPLELGRGARLHRPAPNIILGRAAMAGDEGGGIDPPARVVTVAGIEERRRAPRKLLWFQTALARTKVNPGWPFPNTAQGGPASAANDDPACRKLFF